jgi:hypothetical protein
MILVFSTWRKKLSSQFFYLGIESPLGGGTLAKIELSLYGTGENGIGITIFNGRVRIRSNVNIHTLDVLIILSATFIFMNSFFCIILKSVIVKSEPR